ncbi:MAG: hypothetical protein L6Q98_08025 [Anaerolineae bacterium]|nr:hypothetical protein [Anaerolineae bacterium]NUQ02537.1 hypothetical protein [Anaerolineae bacterium]
MITVLVHINNADAVKGDIEDLPKSNDNVLILKNPREKTDREATWIEDGVSTLIVPWWRITFVEVLPSGSDAEEFPLPFRDD